MPAALENLIESVNLPELRGQRLRLRQVYPDDLPALFEVFSDPLVMRYWSRPAMLEFSEARAYMTAIWRGQHLGNLFQWAIARIDDDQLIGTCTLYDLDVANARAGIGYALRHDHWGGGWAQEALSLVCDYAFETLNLRRMEADVDPRNTRSLKLLERLGFAREGLLRENWEVAGEVQDSVVLGLLQREWRPLD